MKKIILSLLLMPLFFVCLPTLRIMAAPPDECLQKIGKSLDDGDLQAFEQLVDMDAILAQGMDVFLAEAQKPENSSKLAPMLAMMFTQMGGQGGQVIRNLILQEARAFVANGISSGAFAGKQPAPGANQGVLAPLFANASIGRKEIRGIGQVMKTENGWIVPFTVHDYGNDKDYPVIGRFTAGDNGARLTSIENIDQLFAQIKKEAEEN